MPYVAILYMYAQISHARILMSHLLAVLKQFTSSQK